MTTNPDIADLLDRVRAGDIDAGRALADVVERQLQRNLRRPGGDQSAAVRADRNDALREFAALLGNDLSLSRRAEEVVSRVSRYRPLPDDANRVGERGLLHRMWRTGLLHRMTVRQVRRILAGHSLCRMDGQQTG